MTTHRHGFTAVEILVAISIMTIITSIAAPSAVTALRRGQVNEAANTVLDLHRSAQLLARTTTKPGVVFGVSIELRDGSTVVTVTERRGGSTGPLEDASGRASKQVVLNPNTVVWTDSPGQPVAEIAWEYAPGTGALVIPGSITPTAVGVDTAGTLARRFGVSGPRGDRAVDLAIFPIGVGHASVH